MSLRTERMMSEEEVFARVRALLPGVRERAVAAEEARTLPRESVQEFLEAGLAGLLVPRRVGGSELGLDTWFEVVREIGTVDAAHAWCASLLIHHPHYIAQFPREAQDAVWSDGPDVAVAASVAPVAKVTKTDGGFLLSGRSPFASGVGHSSWAMIGGFLPEPGPPQAALFLVPATEYEVVDIWHMVAMRGTGSNMIVTDDVFVPDTHFLRMADLVQGTGPGAAVNDGVIYRVPFVSYAGLTFVAPMLGAAQGALERFVEATAKKKTPSGGRVADYPHIQVRMGRIGADLDAAELLMRRTVSCASSAVPPTLELRARAMRDDSRAVELIIASINELLALSGTAVFAEDNETQRAWRDINLAARHIALNPEMNLAHWSRTQLGVERDPMQPLF